MHDYSRDIAFDPRDKTNQFWIDVQSWFGTGPGFREDVLSMYADQMQGHEARWSTLCNSEKHGLSALTLAFQHPSHSLLCNRVIRGNRPPHECGIDRPFFFR